MVYRFCSCSVLCKIALLCVVLIVFVNGLRVFSFCACLCVYLFVLIVLFVCIGYVSFTYAFVLWLNCYCFYSCVLSCSRDSLFACTNVLSLRLCLFN